MILLCLCVCLVLGVLALGQYVRTMIQDTWLHFFGKRIPVIRPLRPVAPRSRQGPWPPVRVDTRAGP